MIGRRLLAAIARRVPERVVRTLGRHAGPRRALGFVDGLARSAMTGDVVVPRGAAAGLTFNSAGGRAGYGLGTWEPEVQSALAGLARPGSVVYDLGAATGFYTIIAARCVGREGQVVAFEPDQDNAVALRHNVTRNDFDNVVVFELAVATSSGRAVMRQEADDDVNIVMEMIDERAPMEPGEVRVASLDELVQSGRIQPPSLIKMDVEGAEVEALLGAEAVLSSHRPTLLIEVHERWAELEAILAAHGYTYEPLEREDPASARRAVHVLATCDAVEPC